MEALAKSQKLAKRLMTTFTLALILSPIILYQYMTSEKYQVVYFILIQITFILFCICGIVGGMMTAKVIGQTEDDITAKVTKVFPNLSLSKAGYNSYKLLEKQGSKSVSKGEFKIDLNSIPSNQIEINYEKSLISYK